MSNENRLIQETLTMVQDMGVRDEFPNTVDTIEETMTTLSNTISKLQNDLLRCRGLLNLYEGDEVAHEEDATLEDPTPEEAKPRG